MKSRYTLVAILALVSVGIQGADDSSRKQWAAMSAALGNAPSIDTEASANVVGRNVSHLHMGEAAGVPNRNVATDVQKRFDSLINPVGPSFLVQGIQVALTVTLSLAPIFAPFVIKRYFAKKEEIESEKNYKTFIEQNVLMNLRSEIHNLITDLPTLRNQLAIEKNPTTIKELQKLITDGEAALKRKIALHPNLAKEFSENQTIRHADQSAGATPQKPAPAA